MRIHKQRFPPTPDKRPLVGTVRAERYRDVVDIGRCIIIIILITTISFGRARIDGRGGKIGGHGAHIIIVQAYDTL